MATSAGKFIAGYAALWIVLTMLESNESTAEFGGALALLIAGSATAVYYPQLQKNLQEITR